MTGTLERISATGGSVIELKGQPAGVDATIETNGTAHIAVEAMTGTLERISATGGSEIELKSTATGRTIEPPSLRHEPPRLQRRTPLRRRF